MSKKKETRAPVGNPASEALSGLQLSSGCIELLEEKARREGLSKDEVIAEIIEEWVRAGARWPLR